jgi:hypothetical protein
MGSIPPHDERRVRARRGRPPTVTKFWKSTSIRRKLLRLYLCSGLNAEEISLLFRAIYPTTPKSRYVFPEIHSMMHLLIISSPKSIRNVLHELLSEPSDGNTRRRSNLQPHTLEAGRARVRCLRDIRSHQKDRYRAQRNVHHFENFPGASSHLSDDLSCPPSSQDRLLSHTLGQKNPGVVSLSSTTTSLPPLSKIVRSSIRLSTILATLLQSRHKDRPLSWFADIRSLMSASIRSSLFSKRSSLFSVRRSSQDEEDQP